MNVTAAVGSFERSFQIINPAINIVVITLLFLLGGFILGKIAGKLVSFGLKQVDIDNYAKRYLRIHRSVQKLLATVVSFAIYVIAIILAIEELRVVKYIFYILLGAIMVFALMSFLTTIKDFLPNLAAGIYMKKKKMLKAGAPVEFSNLRGRIVQMGMLHTELSTKDGERIIIPNSAFRGKAIRILKR